MPQDDVMHRNLTVEEKLVLSGCLECQVCGLIHNCLQVLQILTVLPTAVLSYLSLLLLMLLLLLLLCHTTTLNFPYMSCVESINSQEMCRFKRSSGYHARMASCLGCRFQASGCRALG